MGVIGLVCLMVSMCSGELLAMMTTPDMLVRESSIDVDSENATVVATADQQTQLRYSGDKENINETLNATSQGIRTSIKSQLKPSTVANSIDSVNIDFGVGESVHLVTSESTFTAASVFNGSVDGLNNTYKVLSESDDSSMKPKQKVNHASGDQVKLFQKYGGYFKGVASTEPKPAVTVHDRVEKEREFMFRTMSGGQSDSDVAISLSDSSEEIFDTSQIHNANDVYKTRSAELERVERKSEAVGEIFEGAEEVEITGMLKSGLSERFDRFRVPANLAAEVVSTEKNTDLEYALMDNSTEESDVAFTDDQGNPIPCNAKLSVLINDSHIINGSLYSTEYNITFPPSFFWESANNSYFGCICSLRPCIRKCCSKGMMYPPRGDVCIPRTATTEPFLPAYFDENTYEPVEVHEDPVVLYGIPCKSAYRLDPKYEDEENYLLPNGSILLPHYNTTIEADEYCLELFEGKESVAVLKCFSDDINYDYEEDDLAAMILYPTGMLVSIPFLLVTFFVYGIIPELRNLHGKSLMCHVSSLAVAYIFLSTVQLGHKKLNSTACVTFAFIIFFAFLASFFWLNVMCFDIFWTFSGIRPLRGSAKERENKKFVMYSCYAWGAPFLLLIICIILDFVPGIPADAIKPELGHTKCWFSNDPALTAYFFGPVGTLLVCNMLFFIITAVRIFQLKQETAMLKGADSRKSDDKANTQRFKLYLKLFVVMGVTWVMEVVSYVVGGPSSMWYVPDLCNTLQGLLIFLLFVWKKNVRTLLARKFGKESEPRSTGSQKSHAATSRSTSVSTLKDRNSTLATESNSIHLKPIRENSDMY